ncbi:MAG: nucleotide sugar dehydrogenase [Spirochaetales bacterium]|nr:nucleotide sugar dehydrogenase [Spirochaetales bacterium]
MPVPLHPSQPILAVIGLGYVGLPLAAAFGTKYSVIGYDVNPDRIRDLSQGFDRTREVSPQQLEQAVGLILTNDPEALAPCQRYIITVPTPTDRHKKPDLTPLLRATATVAKVLKRGDIVIYESTVYPGCTEEDCVPVLESGSGLRFNIDFFCGYSPERINPGDKEHTLAKIRKITSGSTSKAAQLVDEMYASIIDAGTHLAPSIRVAEAAKIIENCQRDINIAFINELSRIFHLMGLDTQEVLSAAQTKWNFLRFQPGLVGGHCIGVDPYYLTYKAESLGYHPEVILAGRRINDDMGFYAAQQTVKLMIRQGLRVSGEHVLVLGITFKENCPDIRNSRVIDIIVELRDFGCVVEVWDPWADPDEVRREYGLQLIQEPRPHAYGAVIAAVAHQQFRTLDPRAWLEPLGVVFDVKAVFSPELAQGRL